MTPADWLARVPEPVMGIIGLGWWAWLIAVLFFREPRRDRRRRERVEDIAEAIERSFAAR